MVLRFADKVRTAQLRHTEILEVCSSEILSQSRILGGMAIPRLPPPEVRKAMVLHQRPHPMGAMESGHRNTPSTSSVCLLNKCSCACHNSRTLRGKVWILEYPRNSGWGLCTRKSCSLSKRASIWISLSLFGIPWAVIFTLDVMLSSQYSFISPSLRLRRVVDWDSPGFKVISDVRWNYRSCKDGLAKLVKLFQNGKASPLDTLPDGTTMPEVSLS